VEMSPANSLLFRTSNWESPTSAQLLEKSI
jgi:hypothetical protein